MLTEDEALELIRTHPESDEGYIWHAEHLHETRNEVNSRLATHIEHWVALRKFRNLLRSEEPHSRDVFTA